MRGFRGIGRKGQVEDGRFVRVGGRVGYGEEESRYQLSMVQCAENEI